MSRASKENKYHYYTRMCIIGVVVVTPYLAEGSDSAAILLLIAVLMSATKNKIQLVYAKEHTS